MAQGLPSTRSRSGAPGAPHTSSTCPCARTHACTHLLRALGRLPNASARTGSPVFAEPLLSVCSSPCEVTQGHLLALASPPGVSGVGPRPRSLPAHGTGPREHEVPRGLGVTWGTK